MQAIIFFFSSCVLLYIHLAPLVSPVSTAVVNHFAKNSKSLIAKEPKIICRSKVYGENLEAKSCENAWEKMPRTRNVRLYASRRYSDQQISLPFRYQSDDGLCVIDVRARKKDEATRDYARGIDVSNAASDLIGECVEEEGIGGSALGFSMFFDCPQNYIGALPLPARSYVSPCTTFLSVELFP